MNRNPVRLHFGLLLSIAFAIGLSGSGCAYHSEYMVEGSPSEQWRTPAGQALVVFLRPSGYAASYGATIMDEKGHFLGDATAETRFAVPMSPGHHTFIIWSENTDALAADLAPNHTYYVEVGPTIGAFSPRFYLYAIKSGIKNFSKRDEWMSNTRPISPDRARGQAYLDTRTADVAERIKRGNEHLVKYRRDPKDLNEHTLSPRDGTPVAVAARSKESYAAKK